MRYGIPEFKMEKHRIDRRIEQMEAEGVVFKPNSHVGVNVDIKQLQSDFDAVLLAGGACARRNLPIEGRELKGIYQAMEYLPQMNRICEGDTISVDELIDAKGKKVVIIGGGDTGADCLGSANRQGAASVHQLEIMPEPPETRAENNPWPEWPLIYRTASAHEEGVERIFSVSTKRFIDDGNGNVKALEFVEVEMKQADGRISFEEIPNTTKTLDADLVFLSMGFIGPEKEGMLDQLGVNLTERGNVARDKSWMTSVDGVFTAGDMQRGQSLIVWALAEGRSAARAIDVYLMGESDLPAPQG
jgi:glutamate synthase (NADPH/NADH) small chain